MEGPLDRLELANSLFTTLDVDGVAYNHWKSNEHLQAAVRGQTDLDLLVRPDQREVFVAIIGKLGFVPMLAPEVRRVPGLESYLGFDGATGSLLHLDVHYRLVLGEQLIKNHHLPLEDWLLDGENRLEGVRVPAPSREFLLLYVRSMLKTTGRQLLRSIVRGGTPLPDRIVKEARWLAEQVDDEDLLQAATSSDFGVLGGEVVEYRRHVHTKEIPWRYVLDRKRSLRRRLRRFERMPRRRAVPKRLWLRFRSTPLARLTGSSIPPRRLPKSAPLVAVVGADGSGKSRLAHELEHWLGWKLTVDHVYFGQPKGGLWWKA